MTAGQRQNEIMSKFKLVVAALLLPMSLLEAEETVWKARVTVETADGKKTQSISAFMPDDPVKLPIILGAYGQCTIEINPYQVQAQKDQPAQYTFISYSISQPLMAASGNNTFIPNQIYSALLPVVFGKDQQLLKCQEGTLTVRLSGNEEKE